MGEIIHGFFAYSEYSYEMGETIESAIVELNKFPNLKIKSWKEMKIGGHVIIADVINEINNCEIFICEISNLNSNVMFELGFAISRDKKIMLFKKKDYSNFDQLLSSFSVISTIGYKEYSNSYQVKDAILEYSVAPLKDSLLQSLISANPQSNQNESVLLYLKSINETESSTRLSHIIQKQGYKQIIDDPSEVRINTLPWYIGHVLNSCCVVCHFIGDDMNDHVFHNAKLSIIAGCAIGFKIPCLMIAHAPFSTPIDYRDLLYTHEKPSMCERIASQWFDANKIHIDSHMNRKISASELTERTRLQQINLGDSVAENDEGSIKDNFIETASYFEAFTAKNTVFIGRKGTGKTANLIKLSYELKNAHSMVLIIKPISYQLEGIIEFIGTLQKKVEKGYFVESIWKYIIYTEIIKFIYETIRKSPFGIGITQDEINLVDFVEKNESFLLPDFSIRLENKLKELRSQSPDERMKVSEDLHRTILGSIRRLVGQYLNRKKNITILLDNLDKSWSPKTIDVESVSMIILGILETSSSIISDFSRSSDRETPSDIRIQIYLRDDIFHRISKYSREVDKIPVFRLNWADKETLLKVIEARIAGLMEIDIWDKYFCKKVKGIECRDYIYNEIMPRPRDIILFTKNALQFAINRKHSLIEEEDILSGEKEYSQAAFNALTVELSSELPEAENLLYCFIGEPRVITYDQITESIHKYYFEDVSIDDIITTLCYYSFFGYQIDNNEYHFVYSDEQNIKLSRLSERFSSSHPMQQLSYKIHPAFCDFLGCS